MLLLIVLQLVAVGVKGLPTEETGETLRKSRQLDLGLQEIVIKPDSRSSENSQPLQNQNFQSLLKEYLPPISPSSSDIVFSTQPQNTLKFDSSAQADKENLLCKLPFDNILCNRKKNIPKQEDFNNLTEDIEKPSKELSPPYNNVNEDSLTTVFSEEQNFQTETISEKQSAFGASGQNAIIVTTKQPSAKKYSSSETATQFTKYSKPQEKSDAFNSAAATIESRSYLPPQPEFASAAQTAVEVIKPKKDEEHNHDHHHHHHHHHHDENFDICSDAFHSFLCAPLKPRKIITGAFPESLRGQGSFIKYQKTLPNREELPAPSNTFQNEYLPPEKPKNFEFGASFSSIKTTGQPPVKTFQNEYLPPENPKNVEFGASFNSEFSLIKTTEPSPSSTFQNEYLPPEKPKNFEFGASFNSIRTTEQAPSNTFRNEYLPPETPKNFAFGASFNSIKATEQPPKTTSKVFSKSTVFTATNPSVKPFVPSKIVPIEQKVVNVNVPLPSIPIIEPVKPSTISSKVVNINVPFTSVPSIPIIEPLKPSTISSKVVNINVPLSPISSIPIIEPLKPSTISPNVINVNVPLNPISSIPIIEPLKPSTTTPNSLLYYTSGPLTNYPTTKTSSSINQFNSVFIPTVTTGKPILSTSTQISFNPLPEKLGSSSSISATFDTSNNRLTQFVPYKPQPGDEDRSYLPPLPSATFISTAKQLSLAPQQSNSPFVSTKISSPLPTQSTYSFSQLIYSAPQSTTRSTSIVIPTTTPTTTKAPLSSFKALPTTSRPATVAPPSYKPLPSKLDNSYLPPLPKFEPVANSISTTVRPFRPPPEKIVAAPNLIERSSNVDRSYLPPDPNVQPAAAQVDAVAVVPKAQNPFHHGRDLCTDPFHSFLCSSPKPRKKITGSIPSRFNADSSNTNELKVKPIQNYQKPIISNLPTPSPSVTQFTTLKPFSRQPAPTEQRVFTARPATVKHITTKPEILRPSETKAAVGYNYPKPASAFPLPSEQQNQISSTTRGYSYPKPLKPFPLPTEVKEVVQSTAPPPPPPTTFKPSSTTTPPPPPPPVVLKPSPTNQAKGYLYPKPEQSFELPQRKGYSYPKPIKPFPLPTEVKEVVQSTTPPPPPPTTIRPSSTNQAKGYHYPKPAQSFELPQRQGYSYPKPQKQLILPTEQETKPFSSVDLLGNLGSAEFIPVNKLEKRNRPSQSIRFGERLKRRDRSH